jgi:hypothetical protein
MKFRATSKVEESAPRRAALYLRVSTGRQAANDVSIPSQRELTRRYCESTGLGSYKGVCRSWSLRNGRPASRVPTDA